MLYVYLRSTLSSIFFYTQSTLANPSADTAETVKVSDIEDVVIKVSQNFYP